MLLSASITLILPWLYVIINFPSSVPSCIESIGLGILSISELPGIPALGGVMSEVGLNSIGNRFGLIFMVVFGVGFKGSDTEKSGMGKALSLREISEVGEDVSGVSMSKPGGNNCPICSSSLCTTVSGIVVSVLIFFLLGGSGSSFTKLEFGKMSTFSLCFMYLIKTFFKATLFPVVSTLAWSRFSKCTNSCLKQ